jgi:hypothetical protein
MCVFEKFQHAIVK